MIHFFENAAGTNLLQKWNYILCEVGTPKYPEKREQSTRVHNRLT